MRAASRERARPKWFRPFRRDQLTVEFVVLAAALLTCLAAFYRDTLTHVEMNFSPEDNGSAFQSYQYDDRSNGGSSSVAVENKRALAWNCDLTKEYAYG